MPVQSNIHVFLEKSIENLKAATESIRGGGGDAKSEKSALAKSEADLVDASVAKSIFSEGDTAEYIKGLLKGSGASINFDQLREDLNKGEGASFAQTVSSYASVSGNDAAAPNASNSISNLDSFNEFLKVCCPVLDCPAIKFTILLNSTPL